MKRPEFATMKATKPWSKKSCEPVVEHTRKILTAFFSQLPFHFVAEIVNLAVYLSNDVRVVNYFMRIEQNVANVAKKRRYKFFVSKSPGKSV